MMACVPGDSNTRQATIKLSHCHGNSRRPNGVRVKKGSGKASSSSSQDDDADETDPSTGEAEVRAHTTMMYVRRERGRRALPERMKYFHVDSF